MWPHLHFNFGVKFTPSFLQCYTVGYSPSHTLVHNTQLLAVKHGHF